MIRRISQYKVNDPLSTIFTTFKYTIYHSIASMKYVELDNTVVFNIKFPILNALPWLKDDSSNK